MRHVYFAERDGRIKIGCTAGDLCSRMKGLGRANLLAWIKGGLVKEKAVHSALAKYSLGHEWFAVSRIYREK